MSPSLPSDCWHLIGATPGPRVVVLGGTHGDELTGIEVVRIFLRLLGLKTQPAGAYRTEKIQGELLLIFGNPQAIKQRTRAASGGRDLNRYFVQTEMDQPARPTDPYDLIRARELAPILARANYVFDIHATSSDSPPFVCFGADSIPHQRLYRLLPVRYVLTDPINILGQEEGMINRGTTDAYVEAHGGIALGYETGKETDLTCVERVVDDVIRLLRAVHGIPDRSPIGRFRQTDAAPTLAQEVFVLTHSVHAASGVFAYDVGMDSGWRPVIAGQRIGRYADGAEERAPASGMLIFPKAPSKIAAGKNLYFLASKTAEMMG